MDRDRIGIETPDRRPVQHLAEIVSIDDGRFGAVVLAAHHRPAPFEYPGADVVAYRPDLDVRQPGKLAAVVDHRTLPVRTGQGIPVLPAQQRRKPSRGVSPEILDISLLFGRQGLVDGRRNLPALAVVAARHPDAYVADDVAGEVPGGVGPLGRQLLGQVDLEKALILDRCARGETRSVQHRSDDGFPLGRGHAELQEWISQALLERTRGGSGSPTRSCPGRSAPTSLPPERKRPGSHQVSGLPSISAAAPAALDPASLTPPPNSAASRTAFMPGTTSPSTCRLVLLRMKTGLTPSSVISNRFRGEMPAYPVFRGVDHDLPRLDGIAFLSPACSGSQQGERHEGKHRFHFA